MSKTVIAAVLTAGLALSALPVANASPMVTLDFEHLRSGTGPLALSSPYSYLGLSQGISVTLTFSSTAEITNNDIAFPLDLSNKTDYLSFYGSMLIETNFEVAEYQFIYNEAVNAADTCGTNKSLPSNNVGWSQSNVIYCPTNPQGTTKAITLSLNGGLVYLDGIVLNPVTGTPPTEPPLPEPASIALAALALGVAGMASQRRNS